MMLLALFASFGYNYLHGEHGATRLINGMIMKDSAQKEAVQRIASGEDKDRLVHKIYSPGGEYMCLSSSISVEEYQRGGYISRYYSLGEIAA